MIVTSHPAFSPAHRSRAGARALPAARAGLAFVAALGVLTAPPGTGAAQSLTRRPVDAGDVTGIDLSIEGALSYVPGTPARLLLTSHDVVTRRDLRVAPGVSVRALVDHAGERPVAEVTTDAHGRAELVLPMPAELTRDVSVVLEARSPRRIRRRFELTLSRTPPLVGTLVPLRPTIGLHDAIVAWGTIARRADGAPAAGMALTATVTEVGARPTASVRRALRTDALGRFTLRLPPRARAGTYELLVEPARPPVEGGPPSAWAPSFDALRATVQVAAQAPATIVAAAAARTPIVPGPGVVEVDVSVRDVDGRPLAGADVCAADRRGGCGAGPATGGAEAARGGARRDDDGSSARTDARGRATIRLRLGTEHLRAGMSRGDVVDVSLPIEVVAGVRGGARTAAAVRVARSPRVLTASVHGAALAPGLRGRVHLRVVRADGRPDAGAALEIEAPRLGGTHRLTADADGRATLEALVEPLARAATAASAEEDCGGVAALGALVHVRSEGGAPSRHRLCLPVDPDVHLRVDVDDAVVQSGGDVRVRVERAGAIRGAPVAVALVAAHARGDAPSRETWLVPLAQAVLPGAASQTTLRVPPEARGLLLVRARPLVGPRAVEARGAFAAVLARDPTSPGDPAGAVVGAVAADGADRGPAARGTILETMEPRGEDGPRVATLRAAEAEGLARRLAEAHRAARTAVEPAEPLDARPGALFGWLAARTPRDEAAPAAWREGRVVPLPAPADPVRLGILRDPERARARFVEGRIALVLQGIERAVEAALPDALDDVSAPTARGRVLSSEVLDALGAGTDLGPEGPRALDGAALTLRDLTALDPAIDFDHVARRITRRRLFRLMLAARRKARDAGLDLPWARRGDPGAWLADLAAVDDDDALGADEFGDDDAPGDARRRLFDGWGRPFALRPAPGGRARSAFLTVVPGYDLVSAGPDGRFGTADDVWDPFARVLPAGGVYARAVGEDALLARIAGVEVGRAAIAAIAEAMEAYADEAGPDAGSATSGSDDDVPPPLPAPTDVDAATVLRAAEARADRAGAVARLAARRGFAGRAALPDGPQVHGLETRVVVEETRPDGRRALAVRANTRASPLVLDLEAPPRLRVGEPFEIPVTVGRADGGDGAVTLDVEASEGLDARTAGGPGADPSGPVGRRWLVLRARAPGVHALTLTARSGSEVLRRAVRILADDGELRRLRTHARVVVDDAALAVPVPADAIGAEAALELLAPTRLDRDPACAGPLLGLGAREPALVAWALRLAGETPPADTLERAVRAAFEPTGEAGRPRRTTTADALRYALAPALDGSVREPSQYLRPWLARRRVSAHGQAEPPAPPPPGPSTEPEARRLLREQAAVALILALSGATPVREEPSGAVLADHLEALRAAIATFADDCGALARAAAALLAADPADAHGHAMLARCLPRLRALGADGAYVATGSRAEDHGATAALLLAAREAGRDDVAARLGVAVHQRAPRALALGGDDALWTLAAAAVGAIAGGAPAADGGPAEPPAEVTVAFAGRRRTVALRDGRVLVPLGPVTAGAEAAAEVRAPGRPLLARLSVRYGRGAAVDRTGPLEVSVDGAQGGLGVPAALTLVVRNRAAHDVARPTVDVAIPAGAVVDDAALAALARDAAVTRAWPADARGLLRIELAPLRPGAQHAVPVAARWLGRGTVRGWSVAAYDAERPAALTVLPARQVTVEGEGAR